MKRIILLIIILSNLNCESNKIGGKFYNGEYSIKKYPLGTVQIDHNLFVDQHEILNIDYNEFMYWTERVYGNNSKFYKEIIPDTTVWNDQEFIPDLDKNYLRHPLYSQYPVVGINLNQANIYTNWRNDRIAELMLYSLNIISLDTFPKPENHFTIERYLNNEFHLTLKYEDVLLPIYKIPSIAEWEFLAKGNSNFVYGTDSLSRWNKKIIKKEGSLFCTKEYIESEKNKSENEFRNLTSFKYKFSENNYSLHGTIGNVAELVSEKGISKGGSWKHSINEIRIENDNIFEKSNCWTGFRNICEWKNLKIKNGT